MAYSPGAFFLRPAGHDDKPYLGTYSMNLRLFGAHICLYFVQIGGLCAQNEADEAFFGKIITRRVIIGLDAGVG